MPPEDALSPWSPLSILVHRPPASLRCLPHTFALLPGQLGSHCAPRGNRNLWNRTMWRPNTHLGSQAHLHTPSSPPLHLPFPGPGASFLNPGAPPWLVPSAPSCCGVERASCSQLFSRKFLSYKRKPLLPGDLRPPPSQKQPSATN